MRHIAGSQPLAVCDRPELRQSGGRVLSQGYCRSGRSARRAAAAHVGALVVGAVAAARRAQSGLGELLARRRLPQCDCEEPDDWSLWCDLARASNGKAQVVALAHAHRLNPLSPEITEFEEEPATQGSIGIVEK